MIVCVVECECVLWFPSGIDLWHLVCACLECVCAHMRMCFVCSSAAQTGAVENYKCMRAQDASAS